MRRSVAFAMVFVLAAGASAAAQTAPAQVIAPAEAARHVGERATVCGVVASTRYAAASQGQPTFLNLGKPYPQQPFTIVIWGEHRHKFKDPERTYRAKVVCVTGTISSYRGVPQIVVTEPAQIEIKEVPKR